MSFKTLLICGALAVLAAAAAAAVVMHHPGSGHRLHHGAPQAGPDAPESMTHAAKVGVAALGKHWDVSVRDATTELYSELLRRQDSTGIRETQAKYGPDEQQSLVVFVPDGGFSELTTVLVYLDGDGVSPTEPPHGGRNIGRYSASLGAIGVNASYRVGPEVDTLLGAEDVRLVLQWVRANIEPFGGNPNNVVLMGNSTGATRVATYLFHQPSQLPGGPGVTAAILSSGKFDGDDAGSGPTPLALVDGYDGSAVPLLLWSGEYDVPAVETSVAELYAKLCRKYADCPMFVQLQGFNHISHVLSIGSADTTVTNTIMRFYHSVIDKR